MKRLLLLLLAFAAAVLLRLVAFGTSVTATVTPKNRPAHGKARRGSIHIIRDDSDELPTPQTLRVTREDSALSRHRDLIADEFRKSRGEPLEHSSN